MKRRLLVFALLLLAATSHAYYQAEQGRWLNRDPIGELGGLNLSVNRLNNLISLIDVLGLGQFYENYGGGEWTNGGNDPDSSTPSNQVGPPYGPPPTDDQDACYLVHDICHKTCDENYPKIPGCTPNGQWSKDLLKSDRKGCKGSCDQDCIGCVKDAQRGDGPTGQPGNPVRAFLSNLLFGITRHTGLPGQ